MYGGASQWCADGPNGMIVSSLCCPKGSAADADICSWSADFGIDGGWNCESGCGSGTEEIATSGNPIVNLNHEVCVEGLASYCCDTSFSWSDVCAWSDTCFPVVNQNSDLHPAANFYCGSKL
jgi:hypothetical protein